MSSTLQREVSVSLQAIGGPTAILAYGGLRFLTDPTFDPPRPYPTGAVKLEAPAIAADDVGTIDAVLLSHDHHLDNLDEAGRAFLPRAARVLTTAEGALRLGGNVVGLEPWDTLDVDRVRVTAVPAHHGPAAFVEENGPVIGFVLRADGLPTVYVSGDNASVDVVREIAERIGRIEIAVLFAGAARVATKAGGAPLTLTARHAAEAARVLGARTVVPIHHFGWRHYSEGAHDLRRAFSDAGLGDRLVIVEPGATATLDAATTKHRTVTVDGLDIFYREAGDPARPSLLLLHGFPSSSQMFRNLIPMLSDAYHVVAPDYPGFGQSAFPPREEFGYTFERIYEVVLKFVDAIGLDRFSIYIQDYGAPIGLRIAERNPDRVQAIVSQSGNAYLEGFTPFWDRLFAHAKDRAGHEASVREYLTYEATRWQWTHGTRDPQSISPDTWELDYRYLDRPGNKEVQLDLFYDYQFNLDAYPAFQRYFRERKPPVLIVWGKNDEIFGPAGATAYLRDLPDAELHLLDTGHFALEEDGDFIADRIRDFLGRQSLT